MNRSSRLAALLLAVAGVLPAQAGIEHLLPRPQQVERTTELDFRARKRIRIEAGVDSVRVAAWCTAQGLTVETGRRGPVIVATRTDSVAGAAKQEEAYRLEVGGRSIRLSAATETGIIRALQTLTQLAEGGNSDGLLEMEAVHILDWAAFRVRGFMHDVGRSYIPVSELKRDIDLLARFKINVFHFHLTENLGWRLQSKRFPQLNEAKNYGRDAGKYYTLEEARDLENYCRERGVTLLPEVDMPGHSAAFTKAFGYDMQSAQGMQTLKELLQELCSEAFPQSPYLHIGTDEVVIHNPRFVPEMVAYVRSLGKRVMAWNPGAPYRTGEIDALQLWSSRGRFLEGTPCIDSRYHYLNHFDTYADVAGLYRSTVCGRQQGDHDHAGCIVAVWNDRKLPSTRAIVEQNGLYAAALALAERAWRGGGEAYITECGVNLPPRDTEAFAEFADWERRFLYHKAHTLKGVPIPYVEQTSVRWRITDPFNNHGNLSTIFPPELLPPDSVYLVDCEVFQTHPANGATVYLRHPWGEAVMPAFFPKPAGNSTVYAYTYIYSPKEQQAGAQISFHEYSRSENDLPPRPGTWDYKGSRIWLNGRELSPPGWENYHTDKDSEMPLKNENFTARSPYIVNLQEGWNAVLLKLPVRAFSSRAIRLEKWMFTFVLTTVNGREALPGIVYSPERSLDDANPDTLP